MALFTGAFFIVQVSLIIIAKPFYACFCTFCVPRQENPKIIVGKVVENVSPQTKLVANGQSLDLAECSIL